MIKHLLGLYLFCHPFLFASAQEGYDPRNYVAYKTAEKPTIDGKLDETFWENAPSSKPFVDISGEGHPLPQFLTQMKMIWDDDHLYIGFHMEEPHLWATYTQRESVIFQEHDIEIFLDPDGDTHNYYEVEINALGTLWDLLMTKPYKDGGKPINGWNINDFEYAVHLEGTLNDHTDEDDYWSLEMAIPWKSLSQSGPNYRPPADGEQWRINFSRVQWQIEAHDKGYRKKINPSTGKSYPEDNWVWSPVGLVSMHLPERWGYLQFSDQPVGEGEVAFEIHPDERIKDELRKIYWAQKAFFKEEGKYAGSLSELKMDSKLESITFEVSKTRFKVSSPSEADEKNWNITEDSRVWKD